MTPGDTINLEVKQGAKGWTFRINDDPAVGFFKTKQAAHDAAMTELESHLAEVVKEQLGLN